MKQMISCTRPMYVCGNEKLKLIGGTDGYFPDFGHHLENEMGGLWLYPIKLLDGYWMHFSDETGGLSNCYMKADKFEKGPYSNSFRYGNGLGHTTVTATRTELAPDGVKGIIVRYVFENRGKESVKCQTRFLARVDLKPCWLSEKVGMYDGAEDIADYLDDNHCFLAKDSANDWYAAIACMPYGENQTCGQFFGPENTVGNGISCSVEHHFELKSREKKEITFFIAGSENNRVEAVEQLNLLRSGKDFGSEKKKKYDRILSMSNLSIRDKHFSEVLDWVKANIDWLILDQDKHGRGLMAGIPEYTWWFGCDSCYALQGVLALGDFDLCKDTLRLLCHYSEQVNGNGRIVHEILPNGYCPNPGNTQETAHFITMVWKYYEYTGDMALVKECLPYIEKSIEWLKTQDDDGDMFPSGYGIIEIAGLNMEMIDTAVYTCEAYDCFARMLKLVGRSDEAATYSELHEKTKYAINTKLWDERAGLYCDAFASYNTINEKHDVIEKLIENSASQEISDYIHTLLKERANDGDSESGWLLNRNWVIATPMEVGISPNNMAQRALSRMTHDDFIGRYGMYLDALKQDAAMTISTGVMAVAQANYGNSDEALRLLNKMIDTFSMAAPGAISEMSPDYGCFVQAWTAYGIAVTVVKYFFGIDPRASEGRIILKPHMPLQWGSGAINNVRILDGVLSVNYEDMDGKIRLTVENKTSYPIELDASLSEKVELVLR